MACVYVFKKGVKRVIAIDNSWRCGWAMQRLPKLETIRFDQLPSDTTVPTKLREMVDGGVDVAIEASGGEYATCKEGRKIGPFLCPRQRKTSWFQPSGVSTIVAQSGLAVFKCVSFRTEFWLTTYRIEANSTSTSDPYLALGEASRSRMYSVDKA